MATKIPADSTNTPRRKLALIIGIGEYADGQNLPNAVNDANDMSSALRRIGFIIDGPKLNLKYTEMRHALVDFEYSVQPDDMVLFYFAGHGRQWEDQNYLIPTDNLKEVVKHGTREKIKISGPELRTCAINAQDLLGGINSRKPFVTIVFLDCCRLYHLRNESLITRTEIEENNESSGFKQMNTSTGSLIAFACAPGTIANDGGKGQRNGLFTKHLLKYITTPKEDIRIILADVTKDVIEESNSKQIPHYSSALQHRSVFMCDYIPMPFRAIWTNIPPNAQWNKYGQTVGGQNLSLANPRGLFVDDDQTVYIADYFNHRIVAWKEGETNGQVVAGGHGEGNGAHQLNCPTDVIVDKERDSLIICDRSNHRVVRWPRQNGTGGETIISEIACSGLTMDEQGSLYVTDVRNDAVRRYRKGESQGTIVAGGNGRGDRLDQLHYPVYICVDRDHSVFVSDHYNNRVMQWIEGAKVGMLVVVGQVQENSLSRLWLPQGILVDQLGTVYVADSGEHRIVRWPKGAKQGDTIVGGSGDGAQANQLNGPWGLSFDQHGHLYVGDYFNDRVQRFTIEMPAN